MSEQGQVVRNLAVLKDEFGLTVAAAPVSDNGEVNIYTIDMWIRQHVSFKEYREIHPSNFRYLFVPDCDLDKEYKRTGRNALTQYLQQKGWTCHCAEATIGSDILDFYIYQELEDYLRVMAKPRGSEQLPGYLINPSWYDFVKEKFLALILGKGADDSEKKMILGRYLLTEPKFEQRFNGIYAKHFTPIASETSTMSTASDTAPESSNRISQQQMYAMMMAPNGRCPKCNHPLNTRNAGLSAGKAAAGGIFAGPVGAVVGASMGRKEYYCPACGYVR